MVDCTVNLKSIQLLTFCVISLCCLFLLHRGPSPFIVCLRTVLPPLTLLAYVTEEHSSVLSAELNGSAKMYMYADAHTGCLGPGGSSLCPGSSVDLPGSQKD